MTEEVGAVNAVIEAYIAACRKGDVRGLEAIFHSRAIMTGYMGDELMLGSPAPFFDAVRHAPSPDGSGTAYEAEITHTEVAGSVASVTLTERGYMGMNFVDYFHLVKVDGDWYIVSKSFQASLP